MYVSGKNNLGAIDWGSLATNLITTGVGYKMNTLQEKRTAAARRATDADAARTRSELQYAPPSPPVSVASNITASPVIMIGAAGALAALLFFMKRKK